MGLSGQNKASTLNPQPYVVVFCERTPMELKEPSGRIFLRQTCAQYVRTCIYIYIYVYACMYVCMYVCMYMHVCMYVYAYVHVCVCVCRSYIYTYIHNYDLCNYLLMYLICRCVYSEPLKFEASSASGLVTAASR